MNECEHMDCAAKGTRRYYVTGQAGKDGYAVYCRKHAESYADPSDYHQEVDR